MSRFGEADRVRRPEGHLDAGAVSGTMKGEEDGCLRTELRTEPASQPDLWCPEDWSGAGAPGGGPQGQSPARGAPDAAPQAPP